MPTSFHIGSWIYSHEQVTALPSGYPWHQGGTQTHVTQGPGRLVSKHSVSQDSLRQTNTPTSARGRAHHGRRLSLPKLPIIQVGLVLCRWKGGGRVPSSRRKGCETGSWQADGISQEVRKTQPGCGCGEASKGLARRWGRSGELSWHEQPGARCRSPSRGPADSRPM